MKGKKTGGRVKGTPNKDNPLKGYIKAHSTQYFSQPVADDPEGRTQFEIDQADLAPDDRVMAELRLMEFHTPKMKAIDANLNVNATTLTIEDRLRELADEDDDD